MTVLPFGPDTLGYEIYQGALGPAWFVRQNDFGYASHIEFGRDRDHALAIMRSHKAKQ